MFSILIESILSDPLTSLAVGLYDKKSRIWETPTLSTDADSRTDTILERLHDFSQKNIFFLLVVQFFKKIKNKSRIRETKNLSTDADSRTDTILERLHDLSKKIKAPPPPSLPAMHPPPVFKAPRV